MFLLPIGLKAKIKNPPWTVAVLVVFTAMVSVYSFSQINAYEAEALSDPNQHEYYFRLRSVYYENCQQFLVAEECELLQQYRRIDKPMSAANVQETFSAFVRKMASPTLDGKKGQILRHWFDDEWVRDKNITTPLERFDEGQALYRFALKGLHEKYQLFSSLNAGVYALLRAQALHGDWLHLFGNMMFLLFFASCLEQILGWRYLTALYWLGGSAGLFVQILAGMNSPLPQIIVGASANVFACAGAFMCLFWRQPLQLWFSVFFLYNRIIWLPTWCFFIFFVLVQQAEGLSKGASPVAYLAHLVGFAVGFAFAALWKRNNPSVSESAVFPYEDEMIAVGWEKFDAVTQRERLFDLMYFNPYNPAAHHGVFRLQEHPTAEALSEGEREYWQRNLALCLKQAYDCKEQNVYELLIRDAVIMNLDMEKVLEQFHMQDLLHISDAFYGRGEISTTRAILTSLLKQASPEQKKFLERHLNELNAEEGKREAQ